MSICSEKLLDSSNKYFWTYPFWYQGARLKQSTNKNVGYMDETAVRARAGVLHMIAWATLLCGFVIPEYSVIIYVGPYIMYDMISGMLFGLTPFCPSGVIGTIIAWNLKPFWAPSAPKRLAWFMGFLLAVFCTVSRIVFGPIVAIRATVFACIILTFLESSLGFCLGCWTYSKIMQFIKPKKEKENYSAPNNNDQQPTPHKDINVISEILELKQTVKMLAIRINKIDKNDESHESEVDHKKMERESPTFELDEDDKINEIINETHINMTGMIDTTTQQINSSKNICND
eukprot:71308_1